MIIRLLFLWQIIYSLSISANSVEFNSQWKFNLGDHPLAVQKDFRGLLKIALL